MSKVFFDELGIPEPDYNLGVGSGSHGQQTGEMLKKTEEVILKEKPGIVMVYGDTNSTLAGALAASKLHVPVAHVEAGLRSFNREMPEEINRLVSDHVSSLLMCPTATAVGNLRKEGFTGIVNDGHLIEDMTPVELHEFRAPLVVNTGDVMYDAMLMGLAIAEDNCKTFNALTSAKGISRYCLATVHRAENTDNADRFDTIVRAFIGIGRLMPVIWPVHPRSRKLIDANYPSLAKSGNISVTEPVGYFDMLQLEKHASVILTDSGGMQKEAYWLKVPCITLRDETEWSETIDCGCNTLAPLGKVNIVDLFQDSLAGHKGYDRKYYGDGNAGEKIVSCISSSSKRWQRHG